MKDKDNKAILSCMVSGFYLLSAGPDLQGLLGVSLEEDRIF
jgi:hypothetical protein